VSDSTLTGSGAALPGTVAGGARSGMVAGGALRVLSWNLFHGRSLPSARRSLAGEFEQLIAGWPWDVALLQEVPPWWAPRLARAAGADWRRALTSRNLALPLRRLLAERWPELVKSNGGGSNAILVRGPIVRYEAMRLRTLPERRVGQLAELGGGVVIANLHCSSKVTLAEDELRRMCERAVAFARGEPIVLGGDLNLRDPAPAMPSALHAAARDVDHVFALGFERADEPRLLDRRASVGGPQVELSDHPPLLVTLHAARTRPASAVRGGVEPP
jgi:endonuclease/exonuclease/phosphatase family metal-dependent hydrolase